MTAFSSCSLGFVTALSSSQHEPWGFCGSCETQPHIPGFLQKHFEGSSGQACCFHFHVSGAAVLSCHCLHEEMAFPAPQGCCAGVGVPPFWVEFSHVHSLFPNRKGYSALLKSLVRDSSVLSSREVYFHLTQLQIE